MTEIRNAQVTIGIDAEYEEIRTSQTLVVVDVDGYEVRVDQALLVIDAKVLANQQDDDDDDGTYTDGDNGHNPNPNSVHPGGNKGGNEQAVNSYLIFDNIQVPQGSLITGAYLTFTADSTESLTTVNATIRAIDEDNAIPPQTYGELKKVPKTTATVYWSNIPTWFTDVSYNSPEIKTVIQELVDRTGWQSGNQLVILLEDDNSTNGAYRSAYAAASGGTKPTLTIEWEYLDYSIATPNLNPISNTGGKTFYTVDWDSVIDATSYELSEQHNNDGWDVIYTGALLSQDLTEKTGGTWSYRVRATDSSDWSTYSNIESTQVDVVLSSTTRIAISI